MPDLSLLPRRYAGSPSVRFGAGLEAFLERAWVLVAGSGDGPYVPTLAATAPVRKLASGALSCIGARPCMGLLSLEDFMSETEGLDIKMVELQR